MRTAYLGNLEVSVVGLGCNNFGRALDAAGSAAVVDAALDAGINFFDTASNYGGGQSESFLGAALGSRRSEAIVGTKFGMPVPGVEGSGGARPEYVRASIERSLSELGTDYIDLFQLHYPDPDTPIEETLGAMHGLVQEGKVRQVGCSNLTTEELGNALAASHDVSLSAFVSNQVEYSMVHRDPETDGLADLCAAEGVALLPYYPLASGLLTGKTRRGSNPQGRLAMDRYQRFLTDENFDLVDRLEAYVRGHGVTMVQVALGWLLSQKAVPSVTPGATKAEQVRSNAQAADWAPSSADLSELNGLLNGTTGRT